MRVTICSSSNNLISDEYKKIGRKVAELLASSNYDLNWGCASTSIMGICYEEFNKKNRKIYGYTTKKYENDIKNLPNAVCNIYDTTFDLKKNLFNDADIIIFLPGGTGTVSELFSDLEEVRSNDVDKKIIIYNENNYYDSLINMIDNMIKANFNDASIYDYFEVLNNIDELKKII